MEIECIDKMLYFLLFKIQCCWKWLFLVGTKFLAITWKWMITFGGWLWKYQYMFKHFAILIDVLENHGLFASFFFFTYSLTCITILHYCKAVTLKIIRIYHLLNFILFSVQVPLNSVQEINLEIYFTIDSETWKKIGQTYKILGFIS